MTQQTDARGKLAVLVPVFNGSHFLRRTVESCAGAGLAGTRYEIIVTDNCSTDGSPESLPAFDRNGARIQVIRNERNLGRVGNWNRALEIAARQGFRYATFLFVGDEWIPGGSIAILLDAMEASGSVLGMAPLRILSEQGGLVREGARISIEGDVSYTGAAALLRNAIGSGRLPFAPIQANLYEIFGEHALHFNSEEGNELNADVEATAEFLANHPGVVAFVAQPYLIWRERNGRFFSTQDPWFVFAETRRSLKHLSATLQIPVDWRRANAIAMLAALREPSQTIPLYTRLGLAARVFRHLRRDPASLSFSCMVRFIWRKIRSGQSYLVVAATSTPESAGSRAIRAIPDQCGL